MRTVAGVVLGYLAMVAGVMLGLTLAYIVLGADIAFRAGSWDVSLLWVLVSILVGFGAALLGGWIARRVAHTLTGPRALAVVVVALGLVLALSVVFGSAEVPGARNGAVDTMAAMRQARTPLWAMLLNPLVGAIGVLVGGGVLGRRAAPAPDADPGHRRSVASNNQPNT